MEQQDAALVDRLETLIIECLLSAKKHQKDKRLRQHFEQRAEVLRERLNREKRQAA